MDYKILGAVLIVLGCGGYGFSIAAQQLREIHSLRQLVGALEYMSCELHCRMTPLPELCRSAGRERFGPVGEVLSALAAELDCSLHSDVPASMEAALMQFQNLPEKTLENLRLLGISLGRFDLEGQLTGLGSAREACRRDLEFLSADSEARTRSCKTLGLCAGAALAILLI